MRVVLVVSIFLFFSPLLYAQEVPMSGKRVERMTLSDVILVARQHSPSAFLARHQFLVAYWAYRSFKAELLPSLNLGMNFPEFNHSLVSLQNATTGEYNYVQSYYMRNSVTFSINQNIAATGGKLSIYSQLERLDQYKPSYYHIYNSQPTNIVYTQPIFGNFNSLKWNKKIEPEKYEKARYEYLEAMEDITVQATDLFFSLLLATKSLEQAATNYKNINDLYDIAHKRYLIGAVTKNELMQLEVNRLNARMEIGKNEINVKMAQFNLSTFLSLPDTEFELSLPEVMPDLRMNVGQVYELSMGNTSVRQYIQTTYLEAEKAIAQAKANRGIAANLFLQFGLNQNAEEFRDSYANLRDRENVRLGIQLPVLDWGVGRGRVRTALSQKEVVDIQLQQYENQQKESVLISVLRFNNQAQQCLVSAQADSIATMRYQLALDLFSKGKLSVLEFNTAQSEKDKVNTQYITEVANFWKYYYRLQRLTLYDFRKKNKITTDFDRLIQK